jgi:hypothetical protein
MMNIFTIADIRKLEPCYDPVTGCDQEGELVHPGGFLPEDWQGTALDILRIDACPAKDRLWLVLREDWIDSRTLRLIAVWCARQLLALVSEPDPRSVNVCNVAERFANGQATQEELHAARAEASEADEEPVWDVAMEAAWAAAWAEAMEAAWAEAAAAMEAAGEAAWAEAWAEAMEAAMKAAMEAAWNAAWNSAVDAACRKQVAQLIAMLLENPPPVGA